MSSTRNRFFAFFEREAENARVLRQEVLSPAHTFLLSRDCLLAVDTFTL